jgi:hypothetical protein
LVAVNAWLLYPRHPGINLRLCSYNQFFFEILVALISLKPAFANFFPLTNSYWSEITPTERASFSRETAII